MPKRTSTARPLDVNQIAHFLVEQSTQESEPPTLKTKVVPKAVSKIMSQMGRKGGKIGGKARLVKMTPEHRRQVASDAAKARWAKAKNTES